MVIFKLPTKDISCFTKSIITSFRMMILLVERFCKESGPNFIRQTASAPILGITQPILRSKFIALSVITFFPLQGPNGFPLCYSIIRPHFNLAQLSLLSFFQIRCDLKMEKACYSCTLVLIHTAPVVRQMLRTSRLVDRFVSNTQLVYNTLNLNLIQTRNCHLFSLENRFQFNSSLDSIRNNLIRL